MRRLRDDPAARRRRRVAQCRRGGGDRLRADIVAAPSEAGAQRCLSGSKRSQSRRGRRSWPPRGTAELEELRVRYLGRKAELTTILRGIAELPAEERGPVGKAANEARVALEALIEARAGELDAAELKERLADDRVDVTLPGAPPRPPGTCT